MSFTALRCLSHRSVGGAGEKRGKRSGEEGPQEGGPGSRDATGGGGSGSSRVLSLGTPTDSSPRLTAPAPSPRSRREGRGAAARAQRLGAGLGGEDVRHALFLPHAGSGKRGCGAVRGGICVPPPVSFPGVTGEG